MFNSIQSFETMKFSKKYSKKQVEETDAEESHLQAVVPKKRVKRRRVPKYYR